MLVGERFSGPGLNIQDRTSSNGSPGRTGWSIHREHTAERGSLWRIPLNLDFYLLVAACGFPGAEFQQERAILYVEDVASSRRWSLIPIHSVKYAPGCAGRPRSVIRSSRRDRPGQVP